METINDPRFQRREPERGMTWSSSTLQTRPEETRTTYEESGSQPAVSESSATTFEDELDRHPESHFLSPIHRYEYHDDSDSEDDVGEWDAGITDFSLFHEERRRAQESGEPLSSKWNGFLAEQAAALERSEQRRRAYEEAESANRPAPATTDEDVPGLTPDASPELKDDLDVESYHGQTCARPIIPNFLTVTVSPPNENEGAALESADDFSLSSYLARKKQHEKATRKLQRPGMRHSRTMSGHIHAWQRPGYDMYTVGEDAEAEDRAERAPSLGLEDEHGRR